MVLVFHVAVLEEVKGKITEGIKERLTGTADAVRDCIFFTRSEDEKAFRGKYDLIIISPEVAENYKKPFPQNIACDILLVPGKHALNIAGSIQTNCIVSFGMSGRDTITLSSLEENGAVLAIQRELVTLERCVLERQEIPLRDCGRVSMEKLMAIYGGLIILGISPRKLSPN